MIRLHVSLDETTHKKARELARQRGISLAALCRRGLQELIDREPSTKPWMTYAGKFDGSTKDSTTIDSVVYDREEP